MIAIASVIAILPTQAPAELSQSENVRVAFNGGISPKELPRDDLAPVAVTVKSSFRSVDGTEPPPQLREISVAINRQGVIYDKGLPTCKVRRIQPTKISVAKRICGEAIVGSGQVKVHVRLKNQAPFDVTSPMLVFNAKPTKDGHRRLLAQVYGRKPPSAFVLAFKISRQKGTFGNVIETTLPAAAQRWAYVTGFNLKLHRTYMHEGHERSFVSAGCEAPKGFPGAVYPFAQARFGFDAGRAVETTLIRSCEVRG